MLIRAGYEITYDCPLATPMTLLLSVRPERASGLVTVAKIATSRATLLHPYRDLYGNRAHRLIAPAGATTFRADFVVEDTGQPDAVAPDAAQHAIVDLPEEVLIFLLGSRYCETQLLADLAWSLFGRTEPGWARVQAIVDYVHERLSFGYQFARQTRTATEAHQERCGVCRDFAHLAVALCRCVNIPARYCTGYLGEIGIAPVDAPMDFSAWFEVYLYGAWRSFDAHHNTPRIGRIPMAHGRDAADVAITTSFGTAFLTTFKVITEEGRQDARAEAERLRA